MSTRKRRAAGKKAARTRARNKTKRRAAGKKAAATRKRRGTASTAKGRTRRTSSARRQRRSQNGSSGFGGSVVSGAGFTIGAGLISLILLLILLPIRRRREGEQDGEGIDSAAVQNGAGLGLQGDALALYVSETNGQTYTGTKLCN